MQEYIRTNFLYPVDEVEEKLENIRTFFQERSIEYETLGSKRLVVMTEPGPIKIGTRETGRQYYFEFKGSLVIIELTFEKLSRGTGEQRLASYLDLIRKIYAATSPRYVCGMHSVLMEAIDTERPSPVTDEGLANNRIDHPSWLMVFPPAMVEEYGREWLLDLPADRIEELGDGGIMVVATERITEAESDSQSVELVLDALDPLEDAFSKRS